MDAKTTEKRPPVSTSGDKVVRMYPNNGLREPVRKYEDTFSAITVVKEMFFPSTTTPAARVAPAGQWRFHMSAITSIEREQARIEGYRAEQKAVEAQLIMALDKAERYGIPLLRILELVNRANESKTP